MSTTRWAVMAAIRPKLHLRQMPQPPKAPELDPTLIAAQEAADSTPRAVPSSNERQAIITPTDGANLGHKTRPL